MRLPRSPVARSKLSLALSSVALAVSLLAVMLASLGRPCTTQKAMFRLGAVTEGQPVKILTLGDSITAGYGGYAWQTTTCALIQQYAGRTCEVNNPAVYGSRCSYWPGRIQAILDGFRPDIVTLDCGTNDDPAETIYGESMTSWSWRYTAEAIHARFPDALVVPSYILYSDLSAAPPWLISNEPVTNDTLFREWYRHRDWLGVPADLQQIPGTEAFTLPDGIHPNARGDIAIGTVQYDAIAASMTSRGQTGWQAAPPPCGMGGHRRGYPRPPFTAC